jgi:hypothetical protein
MCSVWVSEQTAIICLHSVKWLVSVTETGYVHCAVRTGSLNRSYYISSVKVWTDYCLLNSREFLIRYVSVGRLFWQNTIGSYLSPVHIMGLYILYYFLTQLAFCLKIIMKNVYCKNFRHDLIYKYITMLVWLLRLVIGHILLQHFLSYSKHHVHILYKLHDTQLLLSW